MIRINVLAYKNVAPYCPKRFLFASLKEVMNLSEQVARSVPKPVAKPLARPVARLAARPVAKPVVKSVAKQVAKAVDKPVALACRHTPRNGS